MTVFVAFSCVADSNEFVGVFSSRDKADEWSKQSGLAEWIVIEEVIVDAMSPTVDRLNLDDLRKSLPEDWLNQLN